MICPAHKELVGSRCLVRCGRNDAHPNKAYTRVNGRCRQTKGYKRALCSAKVGRNGQLYETWQSLNVLKCVQACVAPKARLRSTGRCVVNAKFRTAGNDRAVLRQILKDRTLLHLARSRKALTDRINARSPSPPPVPSADGSVVSQKKVDEVVLPAPDLHVAEKPKVTLPEFLDMLQAKGEGVTSEEYNSSNLITEIGFSYLIKKYQSPCFVVDKGDPITVGLLEVTMEGKTASVKGPDDLAGQLLACISRGTEIIFLPLDLPGHQNLLIYRPFKQVVERYDPHGSTTEKDTRKDREINRVLNNFFESMVELGDYKPVYRRSRDICPEEGFQSIEREMDNEEGLCQLWSLFLMETILLNPTEDTVNIIQACLEHGNKDPDYFRNLVRGYMVQLGAELNDMFRDRMGENFKYFSVPDEAYPEVLGKFSDIIQELYDTTQQRRGGAVRSRRRRRKLLSRV